VLAPLELKTALIDIIPGFELGTGHSVVVEFVPPKSVRPNVAYENADVVVAQNSIEAGNEQRLVAATKTDFARTMLGVVVRSGASHPDFSSLISAVRSLLAAKSIAIADPNTQADGRHLVAVAARLDANRPLTLKITRVAGADPEVVRAVVRGEAEIGIARINPILAAAGDDLVGRLPRSFRRPSFTRPGCILMRIKLAQATIH
jgi:molybdate transport system substrate-binding protein